MWYLYILQCGDGSLYTGITTDVEKRLEAHRKDRELLEKQLEICTKGAESFAHFSSLDVPVELTQQCEYVKIRFGRLPGAAGTPEQIVANLRRNIELLNSEIAEVNGQMARLWNEEKWKVAGIYASVCSLARLFELRRCAAVRGAHFFYCVWVAQPDIPAFTESCTGVGGLNTAQDMVLPMRRWKQENPEQ